MDRHDLQFRVLVTDEIAKLARPQIGQTGVEQEHFDLALDQPLESIGSTLGFANCPPLRRQRLP